MADIKHIPVKDFRALGYLQEVNRRVLHPVGLALEVTTVNPEGWDVESARVRALAEGLAQEYGWELDGEDFEEALATALLAMNLVFPPGSEHLSGVWDCRSDLEGVLFGNDAMDDPESAERARRVDLAMDGRRPYRDAVGCVDGIQVPGKPIDESVFEPGTDLTAQD